MKATGIAFDPAMLHADYIAGRCVEVGDCWEWQGAVSSGGPIFGRHGTANISVRRLIVDHRGQHRSRRQVVTTTCNNPRCVNPAHVVVRPKGYAIARAAATTGAWQNPARRQRIANWARATKGVLTSEQAAEIRLAPGTQVAIAKQYGVAKQTVWQIKSGANWVDHHNPFAGLMRGAQ